MKKSNPLSTLLKSALKRKKSLQPGYSLRALARDLGVSPAFASNMISGKKLPPKDRLEKLSYCLELDVLEREQLVKLTLLDGFSARIFGRRQAAKKGVKSRHTSEAPTGNILASWVNLALLEGLTLDDPYNDFQSLRARLNISVAEFKTALANLEAAGVIEQSGGRWRKRDEHLYIAGGRSRKEVRAFHEMMLLKAREELLKKTTHEDYQRRLINGFTLALNPEKMDELKAKIIRFMDELSQEASAGHCTEVYQCNFQFFPLTAKAQT